MSHYFIRYSYKPFTKNQIEATQNQRHRTTSSWTKKKHKYNPLHTIILIIKSNNHHQNRYKYYQ